MVEGYILTTTYCSKENESTDREENTDREESTHREESTEESGENGNVE